MNPVKAYFKKINKRRYIRNESFNGMKKTINGFTMVEILIVITVIGILATIATLGLSQLQASARDHQRTADITIIAEALEKYYEKNGEYPDCSFVGQSAASIASNTLKGIDPNVLIAPGSSSNSITKCTDLTTSDGPNIYAYVYSATNGQWTLEYNSETTGSIVTIESRHVVGNLVHTYLLTTSASIGGTVSPGGRHTTAEDPPTITATATPPTYYTFTSWTGTSGCSGNSSHVITMDGDKNCRANFTPNVPNTPSIASVSRGSSTVNITATVNTASVVCGTGSAAQYKYSYRYGYSTATFNSSGWTSTGWLSSSSYGFIGSQGYKYGFTVKARCSNTDSASTETASSSEVSNLVNISQPPTASYIGPNWFREDARQVSWSGTCPANTTISSEYFSDSGYYTAINNSGSGNPNPQYAKWGEYDSWDNDTNHDIYISYYGNYWCKTDFYTSAYAGTVEHKTPVYPPGS